MRTYSIILTASTQTAAKDLISFQAPNNQELQLIAASLSTETVATALQGCVALYRASDIGTGTAALSSVQAWEPTDVVYSTLPGVAALTSLSVAATKVGGPLRRYGADLAKGWFWGQHSGDQYSKIFVPRSGILVLRLDSAISSTALNAELVFELL